MKTGLLPGGALRALHVSNQKKQPAEPQVKQALSHPERFEMFDRIVQGEAGVGERELAEALGLTRAKVKYHLLVLSKADLIAEADKDDGRFIAAVGP